MQKIYDLPSNLERPQIWTNHNTTTLEQLPPNKDYQIGNLHCNINYFSAQN